jgi:hypothetical protein
MMALSVLCLAIGEQGFLRGGWYGKHANETDQEHDHHKQAILEQVFAAFAQQTVSRPAGAAGEDNRGELPPPNSSGGAKSPQPSRVVVAPRPELIDAFLGAERGSRAIIADEAKLSFANGATLGLAALAVSISVEHFRLHRVTHRSCSSSHFAHA